MSEVENGNHQKLVSSSVCLRDDLVHPVDLALAATESQPAQKLPGGLFGSNSYNCILTVRAVACRHGGWLCMEAWHEAV